MQTTNSLVNLLLSKTESTPIEQKGATILRWTDRQAYEVIWVTKKEKKNRCKIRRYEPTRIGTMGQTESQEYEYKKLVGPIIELVYKWGSWRRVTESIVFTDELLAKSACPATTLSKEVHDEVYQGKLFPQKVVPGVTRAMKEYPKVNVIFGVRAEYFDYSF